MAATNRTVEIFYLDSPTATGGAWHDITSDVGPQDSIKITRGRPDESQQIPPSTLNLILRNADGTYSPRNPSSPLYGLIGRNTPIRVSAPSVTDTFTRTVSAGSWGTPDVGPAWTSTGSQFSVNGSAGLMSHSAAGGLSQNMSIQAADVDIYVDIDPATPAGTGNAEYSIRTRVNGTTYIEFLAFGVPSSAPTIAVREIVSGSQVQIDGFTSISGVSAGDAFHLHVQITAGTARMRAWAIGATEPTTWARTITNFNAANTGPGTLTLRSSIPGGWTNTPPIVTSFDNFTLRSFRFYGEVESWPVRWDTYGEGVWAPITANGITRRLNAPGSTRASVSALRRDILDSSQPTPVAYWPLEEGKDATVPLPYNGLGDPGVIDFADAYQPGAEGPTGTLSLYGLTPVGAAGSDGHRYGRGITLPVPAHTTGVEIFTMHARWRPFDNPKVLDGATFADLNHRIEFTSGGVRDARINFQSTAGSSVGVSVYFRNAIFDLIGSPDSLVSTVAIEDGNWHEIQIRMVQNGANIDTELWVDGVMDDTSTISSVTMGNMARVVLGAAASYDTGLVVGVLYQGPFEASHITVHDDDSVGQFYDATIGHAGETAADRIERLCDQDGIPITIIGTAADSNALGVQRVAPFLDLLNDAADADMGILYESRFENGLTFRTQKDLYNQTADLSLSYSAGGEVAPPLEPVEDTDVLANDVQATRYQGGFANVVQETGPLNVQEPSDDINGVGRYKKDVTLVLAEDDQCVQAASWIRHIGTVDEARYPVISLDLTAMDVDGKSALAGDSATLELGDRISITGLPSWLPPDSIEALAEGFSEVIESHHWTIAVNAVPGTPYDVLQLETSTTNNLSRIPAGVTTLNEALDTTETGVDIISVTTRWIDSATYSSQFPLSILVGGEKMTVTALTGTGLTQTMTVTRSVNGVVKSHASGTAVQLFRPPVIAR